MHDTNAASRRLQDAIQDKAEALQHLGVTFHIALTAGYVVVHEYAIALRQAHEQYLTATEELRLARQALVQPAYDLDATETGGWGVPR